jgi:hypothetical protein
MFWRGAIFHSGTGHHGHADSSRKDECAEGAAAGRRWRSNANRKLIAVRTLLHPRPLNAAENGGSADQRVIGVLS